MSRKRTTTTNDVVFDAIGSVRIRGRRWQVGSAPLRKYGLRGMCCSPKRKGVPALIIVSTHLRARSPMQAEAVLHETLHAAFPKATEAQVRSAAHALTGALALFGFVKP